ncbi:MAG: hypothetical protein AAFR33_02380, partial [Pseudomonadota bacterium]
LTARDPGNLQFAVDMAVSNAKLGQVAQAWNDLPEACSRFAEAEQAFLAALDIAPSHAEARRMVEAAGTLREETCREPASPP